MFVSLTDTLQRTSSCACPGPSRIWGPVTITACSCGISHINSCACIKRISKGYNFPTSGLDVLVSVFRCQTKDLVQTEATNTPDLDSNLVRRRDYNRKMENEIEVRTQGLLLLKCLHTSDFIFEDVYMCLAPGANEGNNLKNATK